MIDNHQLTDIALHHINANHPGRDAVITNMIDFAFIDARKSYYHLYLQTLLPHMAPHSVIICDDVIEFANKLTQLYEFLDQNQMNYQLLELSDGDGVLVIKL
jgi:predicted O-methyltransferase YrrM